MSETLLQELNGGYTGNFHRWLQTRNHEPRICWYPSAGADFRDALYLHPAFSGIDFKPDTLPQPPDIFLHTDYWPWEGSRFLDTRNIYRDRHTSIFVKTIEELPRCDLATDPQIVMSTEGSSATGRVIFLELEVKSDKLGKYQVPVLYVFAENTAFCAERMLPLKSRISHIIHIRYGGGLGGGGKSTGRWILNTLDKLQCELFITDSHYGESDSDTRIIELYPALAKQTSSYNFEKIGTLQGEKWSNHGTVTWNRVVV